jgi:hypothetical protein
MVVSLLSLSYFRKVVTTIITMTTLLALLASNNSNNIMKSVVTRQQQQQRSLVSLSSLFLYTDAYTVIPTIGKQSGGVCKNRLKTYTTPLLYPSFVLFSTTNSKNPYIITPTATTPTTTTTTTTTPTTEETQSMATDISTSGSTVPTAKGIRRIKTVHAVQELQKMMISEQKEGSSSTSSNNEIIKIQGWVRTVRQQKTVAFIQVNDGSNLNCCNI